MPDVPRPTAQVLSPALLGATLTIAFALAADLPAQQRQRGGQGQGRQRPQPSVLAARADLVSDLEWRELGPANPTGRITDIDVHPSDPNTWYVGTAGGGLWKTKNRGITWDVSFDDQSTVSIGDVAVAPSNPDVVWVASGEENARNSVGWGNGVYKSTDGGKTFAHKGLKGTFQIGHIAIHPTDANVVFVAALGRLWGDNPDRGVFRSKDGGETWEKVLYLNEKTGCIDVRVDPEEPDVVLACMYERRRDGFDGNDPSVRFGEGSGLFRSADGGDTWTQIDDGLPSCKWGRSGLTVFDGDSSIAYLIVETERSGWATGDSMTAVRGADEDGKRPALMGIRGNPGSGKDDAGAALASVTNDGPADSAGLKAGDVITKLGDTVVSNYDDLVEQIRDFRENDTITVTYERGGEEATAELTFGGRAARGARAGNGPPNTGRLGGQRQNVQRSQGKNGFETGGVFRTDDRGLTWTRVNSMTERPFYYSVIQVAPSDPDRVYSCGVSFWTSDDGGKTFESITNGIHVDFHAIWVHPTEPETLIACCDGGVNISYDAGKTWEVNKGIRASQFYKITADNRVPYHVWGGLQDNGTWGGPSRSDYREGITPLDWKYIYSGDGFGAEVDPVELDIVYATSQNGSVGGVDLGSGGRIRIQKPRGRFNWDTPFFLSPHNRLTYYVAGNLACRGDRVGNTIQADAISPELGLTERGTATAFAESPRVKGLLYVGTDDGALWRHVPGENGAGGEWTEIHSKVLGMPGPRYVSHVEPSHHDDDRVYVTFEGHRSDDLTTYVFVSEDRGDTWKPLSEGLPAKSPAHVVREDHVNPSLLFVGTEFTCHVSLDRGQTWTEFDTGLPTVSVRDLFIHRRDADLITGTHGRGVWVVDIAPLRQMASRAGKDVHLFEPEVAYAWRDQSRVLMGDAGFRAANPRSGVAIYAWVKDKPSGKPKVTIHDLLGEQLATIEGKQQAGIQRFFWNGSRSADEGEGQGRRRRGGGGSLQPGTYTARMKHGDDVLVQTFEVRPDPQPHGSNAALPTSTTPNRSQR